MTKSTWDGLKGTANYFSTADLALSGGPTLGPFPLRGEALAAEVGWINEHVIGA